MTGRNRTKIGGSADDGTTIRRGKSGEKQHGNRDGIALEKRTIPREKIVSFIKLMSEFAKEREEEFGLSIGLRENLDNEVRIHRAEFAEGERGEAGIPWDRSDEIRAHTHPYPSERRIKRFITESGTTRGRVIKNWLEFQRCPSIQDLAGILNPKDNALQYDLIVFPDGKIVVTHVHTDAKRKIERINRSKVTGEFSAQLYFTMLEQLENKFMKFEDDHGIRSAEATKLHHDVGSEIDWSADNEKFVEFSRAKYDEIKRRTGVSIEVHTIDTLPDFEIEII